MLDRPVKFASSLCLAIGVGACASAPTYHRYDIASTMATDLSAGYEAPASEPGNLAAVLEGNGEYATAMIAPALQEDPTLVSGHTRGWSVTPRIWLAQVGTQDSDDYRVETYLLPMFGASATWAPESLDRFSFLITLLVGSGSGDIFVPALNATGDVDSDRVDLEILARYSFPGRNFFLFFGPRFVTWEEESSLPGVGTDTFENDLLILEGGLGMLVDMTDDSRHQLFSNLTLGLAFSDWDWSTDRGFASESGDSTERAWDINLGYQYRAGDVGSFIVRYRMFAIGDEDDFGLDKLTTFSGPEIGFTFYF